MSVRFYFTFAFLVLQILERTTEGVHIDKYFPPKFVQPCTPQHIKKTYHTIPGSNVATISWSKPKATDLNGDQPSVEQVLGPRSGGKFNGTIFGQNYMIVYVATDKDGLKDSCSFSFTVIVPSCKNLDVVDKGRYACTDGTKNESSCALTCQEGYKATGSRNTTCEGHLPAWKNVHICERNRCNDPVVPENGYLSCSNNTYEYQTTCKVLCRQGFFEVGPSYIICMANGKWSVQTQCITDGNWSDWTLWSKCSHSCDTGLRTRHRSCNNPPPDKNGSICHGSYSDVADCKEEDCKECPKLKKFNDSIASLKCEIDHVTKLETCSVSCLNETIHTPWFEEFKKLKCGRETGFIWIPGNVTLEPCLTPAVPERVLFDTEMIFHSNVSIEQQPDCKNKILQNMKDAFCDKSIHCNLTAKFQSTADADEVHTQLILLFDWYLNYVTNSTHNTTKEEEIEELKKRLDAIGSMGENLKQFIGKVFDLNSECAEFHAIKSSLLQKENVSCAAGYVPYQEICLQCPVGTYIQNSQCNFCPKGTTQEKKGSSFCEVCPYGYTTTSVGSSHVILCQKDPIGDARLNILLENGNYIAAIASAVVATVVALASFITWYCKKGRRCNHKDETTPIKTSVEYKPKASGCGSIYKWISSKWRSDLETTDNIKLVQKSRPELEETNDVCVEHKTEASGRRPSLAGRIGDSQF